MSSGQKTAKKDYWRQTELIPLCLVHRGKLSICFLIDDLIDDFLFFVTFLFGGMPCNFSNVKIGAPKVCQTVL